MPGIDRTTIISGPAVITFAGQSFWSKGDISLSVKSSRFKIPTASFGDIDERVKDRIVEVSFEPDGRFTTGLAAVLWPYGATAIGASIYGATDRPLVIWSRDGVKVTLPNAALTQMPSIRLGVGQTIQGSVKFTGLVAKSTDPATAGAYYTTTSTVFTGDASFNGAEILTRKFSQAWGSTAPWDAFETESGWEISFGLSLAPQVVDSYGTVDMRLQNLSASAKAVPVGPTYSHILQKLLPNTALGSSVIGSDSLVISETAGSPPGYFSLCKASLVDASLVYGTTKKRIGSCEWTASRSLTAGALDALFTIAASV